MLNSYLDPFLALVIHTVRQRGDAIVHSCPSLHHFNHQIYAGTLSCESAVTIRYLEILACLMRVFIKSLQLLRSKIGGTRRLPKK